jgi:1-acyl-sn-glycerol-3-phosphate acyltransferase
MRRLLRSLFFLLLVKPLLAVMVGVNVFGRANLPKKGPFILIANHNSHMDTLTLMNLFPLQQLHHIHPAAAEDYFCAHRFLSWFSGTFFNVIPIPRTHITKANNPLKRMCQVLDAGESLIVFPEGSRGQPEHMAPFQSGIVHLIQKYPDVSVVPVFLKGMGRVLPKGEFVPVPFFCDVVIGEPLQFAQNSTENRDVILARLERAVRDLEQKIDV